MTVGEALALGRERLAAISDSAYADSVLLLEWTLARSAGWLLAHDDRTLGGAEAVQFEGALERRARGEPLAYVIGSAGFYGRTFAVTPAVLVPRPESEHLIMAALDFVRARAPAAAVRICDVGTGSGILAITLALEDARVEVVALDVSPAALAVATENARTHGVVERIQFLCGDLLRGLPEARQFDCIVANLPYVAAGDMRPAPDPTSFEPRLALDGGPSGLRLYERLLPEIPSRFAAGGLLLMEAGADTAAPLAAAARATFGARARVETLRDYAGRDRIVALRQDVTRDP